MRATVQLDVIGHGDAHGLVSSGHTVITGTDADGELMAKPLVWSEPSAMPRIFVAPAKRGEAPLGVGDKALAKILRDRGFSVRFQYTAPMKDAFQATVNQNVGLIKSIAQQHLSEVEGLVMRSVATGRDIGGLSRELEKRYAITRRRADFIARSQNNMATATMHRARQVGLGVKEAIWMHSHAGAKPRPSHVKAGKDKVVYEIAKGWFDPDEGRYILPGDLPNCRCASRIILPT